MGWRIRQDESRRRYLEKFDAGESAAYDANVGTLAPDDLRAYREDLAGVFAFRAGQSVLDAGAGSGTLTQVLAGIGGLSLTALEPAPHMVARLRAKPDLRDVATVTGFCDHEDDRRLFAADSFDAVFSRQLANGLYDPLAAFANWRHWLRPGGAVVLIDGLYGRDAWQGRWEEDVDMLPLSACQGTAAIPYLLEQAGFAVTTVQWLPRTNASRATRTRRYVVVAVPAN